MGTRWRTAWTFGLAAGLCGACSAGDDAPGAGESLAAKAATSPSDARVAVETAEAIRLHLGHDLAPIDEMASPRREAPRADVRLPLRASGAFRVADTRSALAVEVALTGAREVAGEAGAGIVAYPAGYRGVADIVHHPTESGAEDYVFFRNALPDVPELRYTITLGENVAGLRLVGQTLELLDADGVPRLRMAPPWAKDGDGKTVWMNVAVEGCKISTDARLPMGRPVVDPGARQCEVKLSWEGTSVRAPLLVDPAWTTTDAMALKRFRHTASLLPDGRVLVAGGDKGGEVPLEFAEVYDPALKMWIQAPSMMQNRLGHTATTLEDGRVLVLGGKAVLQGTLSVTNSAEIFTPGNDQPNAPGTWSPAKPMTFPRALHTATLLSDGRVLVTGGKTAVLVNTTEIYDPETNTWEPGGDLKLGRYNHTATLLDADRILVAGGEIAGPSQSAELWDPATKTWTQTNAMSRVRSGHTATRLPSGRVLVAGGSTIAAQSIELFDPASEEWQPGLNMTRPRKDHAASVMAGGRILVTGGGFEEIPYTTEIFDPATQSWTEAGSMGKPRSLHTSTTLHNGRVLVAGGTGPAGVLVDAEIYTPLGAPCDLKTPCDDSFCVDGVCCNTPCDGQCEACDGARVGICEPVAGKPHGARPACNGTSEACATCDGVNPFECSYPSGNSCGKECKASTLTVFACDGSGNCAESTSNNCAPYNCNAVNLSCETECTSNTSCAVGSTCNTEAKTCVTLPTKCLDSEILQLPDGNTQSCAPYACRNGACLATCASVDDCSGAEVICDEKTSNCMKWTAFEDAQSASTSGTCTMAAPGAPAPSRAAWLFALAAASLLAARRPRPRP
ncbi:kelch repeat-containing protein [Polyangium sp. y55x31]|uniref:Kelch repeat-containing protein n=1 Tax=Polyangium sp. y55x31 TaxID=3042688 RepID=UPI0024824844|nr:kelch repeat-containing protein [Polyangium sp. y55x31]MDI1476685.1 kelch repeat-containing protein [Polyangium sp. y55x31]